MGIKLSDRQVAALARVFSHETDVVRAYRALNYEHSPRTRASIFSRGFVAFDDNGSPRLTPAGRRALLEDARGISAVENWLVVLASRVERTRDLLALERGGSRPTKESSREAFNAETDRARRLSATVDAAREVSEALGVQADELRAKDPTVARATKVVELEGSRRALAVLAVDCARELSDLRTVEVPERGLFSLSEDTFRGLSETHLRALLRGQATTVGVGERLCSRYLAETYRPARGSSVFEVVLSDLGRATKKALEDTSAAPTALLVLAADVFSTDLFEEGLDPRPFAEELRRRLDEIHRSAKVLPSIAFDASDKIEDDEELERYQTIRGALYRLGRADDIARGRSGYVAPEPRFELRNDDDSVAWTGTADEFLVGQEEDEEVLLALSLATEGQTAELGGGAAPLVTLRRLGQ